MATTQSITPETDSYIRNLTTLAFIFQENRPEKLLALLHTPPQMEGDSSLHYDFIANAVRLFMEIRQDTAPATVFQKLLREEEQRVPPHILRLELALYDQYKSVILDHFRKLQTSESARTRLAMRDMIMRGMLHQCETLCNPRSPRTSRLEALANLSTTVEKNADSLEPENLRTMLSFLIQRLISGTGKGYEDDPEIRKQLVMMVATLNLRFFGNNQGIWVRLKRYTTPEEKAHISTTLGYSPFGKLKS